VATIGLAPLSMIFFQQVSVVGLLANLVAIPLVTLLITPLALLGVLLPPLWLIAATLVQGLRWALGAMAGLAVGRVARRRGPGLGGGLRAAGWRPGRAAAALVAAGAGLPLVLPLLVPPVPRPAPGEFEVVAADIGQGTAVLVRTARHLLVYDAGPAYSAESDAGVRVLLPLLRARGERQVDLFMLSHRDADHVGGAAALLAGLPVRQLSSSLADDHPLLAGSAPHRPCDAGQAWSWDGCNSRCCTRWPDLDAWPLKPNALSCVLRVQGVAGGRPLRLLLTGDIEAAQEAALLARSRRCAAQADVLLVPHHGSRTSSARGVHRGGAAPAWRWCRPATAAATATRRRMCMANATAAPASPCNAATTAAPGNCRRKGQPNASASGRAVTGIIQGWQRPLRAAVWQHHLATSEMARSLQASASTLANAQEPEPVSIHVALNHVTHYRYDRRSRCRPRSCACARRRTAAPAS
jgi:beta-lactamase superfamily II metal-dependent hydrolase